MRTKARSAAFLLLASLLLASPLLSAPASAADFGSRTFRRSPAHPRVILAPRIAATATLRIIFHTGAADDGLQSGLTRLSQHMLVEGNARVKHDAFWRDVYAAGASLHLETSVREATFELTAPRARFDALAEKLLAMTLSPKLREEGLERARQLTLADELESGGFEDLVSFVASRLILEGTKDGGEYNNERYGDRDTLRRTTFEEVVAHVEQKLAPANATIILTGGFDERRLSRALARHKGGRARPFDRPDVRPYLPVKWDRWAPREIHLHAQLLELDDVDDVAAAQLLVAVLEERMMWQLRKLGVTYGTSVIPVIREWADLVVIFVPVGEAEDVVVELELRKLLDGVAEGRFLGDEFERNKRSLLLTLEQTDRSPPALAHALSHAPGRLPWLSPAVVERIRSMSQAEFVGTVRPWLQPKSSVNVLFGRSRAVPAKRSP